RTAAAQAASSSPPGPTRPGPARKNSPGRPLPAAPPQPQIAHPAGEPKETEESRFMPLRMRDSRPHAKTKLPFLGSVVVLPFANLSGDPAQDYFADGVTENLTTDLSRIRDSFVIARNTAFTYRGKAIDAKAIGKELGVRYVLEGSVQRDQNRVRVNAQLIDAETGADIWADRFEADMADLFKLQDQVVAQLANALRYELGMAEAAKAAGTQNPDAIDLAMRGWAVMPPHSMPSKGEVDAARPFFEQALKIDPDNSEALAGKANATLFEYIYAPRANIDYDAAILGLVDRAIALDRGNMHAYRTKAQYLLSSARPEDALRALDAGLAIDPSAA